jgi:hypothetical protein
LTDKFEAFRFNVNKTDSSKAMPDEDLRTFFKKKACTGDGAFAIAWALMDLSDSQEATAKAIQKLGNADAATPFGAIESLGMQVEKIADAISALDFSRMEE